MTSRTQRRVICEPTCHHTLANGRITARHVAEVLEKRSTWKGTPRHAADKPKHKSHNHLFRYHYYIVIVNIKKLCCNLVFRWNIKSYFFTIVFLFFCRWSVSFIVVWNFTQWCLRVWWSVLFGYLSYNHGSIIGRAQGEFNRQRFKRTIYSKRNFL